MKQVLSGFFATWVILGVAYAASGHVVSQAGKKFSEKRLTVKVGEMITFVNDDKVVHNVHSLTKGFEFDLGAQKPGESADVSFSAAGKLKARCAIHPKMKINIKVQG